MEWIDITIIYSFVSVQGTASVVIVPGYRFSLVSTIEELLERKNRGSGLENEITAVGDALP
jgi:hypothetical protein